MRLPTIQGVIRRRLLVNFRVDPEVIQRHLPDRFRPKLQAGYAVAGICLIRLEHLRPRLVPEFAGLNSENAAHRIAVLWDDERGTTHEGVFIPRRDTNSPVNLLLGGRVFPGEHHQASFEVHEATDQIHLAIHSSDGEVEVEVAGRISDALPSSSIFPSPRRGRGRLGGRPHYRSPPLLPLSPPPPPPFPPSSKEPPPAPLFPPPTTASTASS